VSGKLFLESINSIFIHYLNEIRESEEFAGSKAVLLMSNRLPRMGDAVIAVLTRERVTIIRFTNHTIHIFQVHDIVLLFALEKYATDLSRLDEEQPAAAFIIKVSHDFK
jgi:hypothetical protein